MIIFNIDQRYRHLKLKQPLTKAIEVAFRHQSVLPSAEVSVVLTTDSQVQRLNRNFRKINKQTDVLSFPANELDKESGGQYLGDIVISVPRARSQAKAGGHPLAAELQLLAVHGLLHLLGHDHASGSARKAMWLAQDQILKKLGLSIRSRKAETRLPN